MATESRGTVRPLIERLREEPQRFDSHQALRILETLQRAREARVGSEAPPRDDGDVDFRGALSLAFPTNDIESIAFDPGGEGDRPVMTVNFLTLGGVMGPLPAPFTEFVLDQGRDDRGITAPRDFLDLFNNRLVFLAMESARRFRLALQGVDPVAAAHARFLKAILGLGTEHLEPLLRLHGTRPFAPSLLALAALVHQRPASAHAVERAIATHFGVEARVIPYAGAWLDLPDEAWTVLGRHGRNRSLGVEAIAGRRVWDQAAGIEVALGPLSFDQACGFLPGARGCAELATLLEIMLADDFSVRARMMVRPETIPRSRVGAGRRLGWNARLGRRDRAPSARLGWRPPVTMRLGWTSWLGRPGRPGPARSTAFALPPPTLGGRAAP